MSFYNTKSIKQRLCNDDKSELRHTFGRFSKYFQCDEYYNNLEIKDTHPIVGNRCVKSTPKTITSSEFQRSRVATKVLDRTNDINVKCTRHNQSSDKKVASVILSNNVPTRGNSTRSSITSNRPGCMSAPGVGVDIKNNSYDRMLNRKVGSVLDKECNN
jgi:hypothetical protein|tara:strand:- start:2177 stop:2653 length:477 start_codon:yes stop_codon:yes gene_type:complete